VAGPSSAREPVAQVWWARRQDADPALAGLLDETEHGRWTAYRRDEDRDRFLVGNALVKCAVAARTGRQPATVILDRGCTECGKPHGKPRITNSGLELSVSHSGDKIAVAVIDGSPIGVDVEQASSRRDDVDGLARFSLAEQEQEPLAALPAHERQAGFLVYWTRKEAVTKATGDGLRVSFREVIVSAPSEPPRLLAWPYGEKPERVTLFDLDGQGPGYAAALAVIGPCRTVATADGSALLAENIGRL
jgi:4'-phosphopantetheinyl transferase